MCIRDRVNLGLEGIMLISALAGVLGSAFGGNLVWGVAAGMLAAVAVSAVFALSLIHIYSVATSPEGLVQKVRTLSSKVGV